MAWIDGWMIEWREVQDKNRWPLEFDRPGHSSLALTTTWLLSLSPQFGWCLVTHPLQVIPIRNLFLVVTQFNWVWTSSLDWMTKQDDAGQCWWTVILLRDSKGVHRPFSMGICVVTNGNEVKLLASPTDGATVSCSHTLNILLFIYG